MKYITAEGPSYEWHTGQYRLAGHTYPAPHEPARFEPFDPEITARAMRNTFMFEPVRSEQLRTELETANELLDCYEGRIRGLVEDKRVFKGFWKQEQSNVRRLGELAAELTAQLETARKALDRIRLHNDSYVAHLIATEALAQIGAGQKGGE